MIVFLQNIKIIFNFISNIFLKKTGNFIIIKKNKLKKVVQNKYKFYLRYLN